MFLTSCKYVGLEIAQIFLNPLAVCFITSESCMGALNCCSKAAWELQAASQNLLGVYTVFRSL
jgi:hypothetical protein